MLKLATHIPNLNDSTSFYRAMGPLSHLRRKLMPDLVTHHLAKYSWATLAECDALFMQRGYTSDEVGIMEMAKDIGIPIWVDYDDLLFDVPTDNPAYFLYMAPDKRKNVAEIIQGADLVTVTTAALAKRLSSLNKNVKVIPNAIDTQYFKYRTNPAPKRTNSILWRGSRTHQRDVFEVCQSLILMHKEYPDWVWNFCGDNLWLLTDNMVHERTVVMKPIEWPTYFRYAWDLAPSVTLAPLHDHIFNHCKSNIAWMEGVFAGAVTICRNWDEWKVPGALRYESEREFSNQLEMVLKGNVDIESEAYDGWEFVMENLTLDVVNKTRLDLLRELVGK